MVWATRQTRPPTDPATRQTPPAGATLGSVPRVPSAARALTVAMALALASGGCGKGSGEGTGGGADAGGGAGVETVVVHVGAAGTAATATRNTTRLGGAGPVLDAAAIARAAYPGLTPQTRPQAVVVAEVGDWPQALTASVLAAAPLGAPLLYAEGGRLARVSELALRAMDPTGASALGGAQVILLGSSIQAPPGWRARGIAKPTDASSLATAVAQLSGIARGSTPRQAIVVSEQGARALAMPAAGLAAQSGTPILFVGAGGVPAATAAELRSLGRPAIYTVGTTAIDRRALAQLEGLGTVKRVEVHAGEDLTPAGNAIAVARFADGAFGWGVREPGHGLAFLNASRPFDAPAAAILSATGDYAPLLLLDDATGVPGVLSAFLADIRPAAPGSEPVRGVYNHGWLIGGERAIAASTQAEVDAALEIAPQSSPPSETSSLPVE